MQYKKQHKWSDPEVLCLKRNYFKYTLQKLQLKYFPNRTISSLQHKTGRLNLLKTVEQRNYTGKSFLFSLTKKEDAYFLGLALSDGCVIITKRYSRFTFASNDIDLVLFMVKYLKMSTEKIKQKDKSYKIEYNNKFFCKSLAKFGVVPRKSYSMSIPYLHQEFYQPFVCGFFDGDGSLYFNKKTNKFWFGIYGLKNVLERLKIIIENETNITLPKILKDKRKNSLYKLQKSSKDTLKILQWIYSDASIGCKRKKHLLP